MLWDQIQNSWCDVTAQLQVHYYMYRSFAFAFLQLSMYVSIHISSVLG